MPRLRRRSRREADSNQPRSTDERKTAKLERRIGNNGYFSLEIFPSPIQGWEIRINSEGEESEHTGYRMEPVHEVAWRALGEFCKQYD